MSNENAELVRRAYQAYASGDLARMLEFVDPDLEWTYLDPALEHPTPCAAGGSLPCATAATGKRPSSLPASGRREQRPLAILKHPQRR
jgi:ketosteroid isomerase-like protein